MEIYFDVETKSSVSLSKRGTEKYLSVKAADILCVGYRTSLTSPTSLWIPHHEPAPDCFLHPEGNTYFAHNAMFEYRVLSILGGKYGIPHIPYSQFVDVMALVARYGFPQSLDGAAKVLVGQSKISLAPKFMEKMTQPPWEYTQEEWDLFCEYCKNDVDIMCEVIKALPKDRLSDSEQQIWLDTCGINLHGVPVDSISASVISEIIDYYVEQKLTLLDELTDGEVQNVTQRVKLRRWINDNGGDIPNLKKNTVRDCLSEDYRPDWMTEKLYNVLDLVRLFGSTSITKYKSIINQFHKGRIYHNLKYHGAHTGRETGLGFQIHNLPRASVKDPEAEIQKFMDDSIYESGNDPVFIAKALIRPMIKTTKRYILVVLDYSGIENRVLYWLTEDEKGYSNIFNNIDEYIEFASLMYNVPESEVTKAMRDFGKVVVLGAGYGLSAGGLAEQCYDWGLRIPYDECEKAINLYRNLHPQVKASWNILEGQAKSAVYNHRQKFPAYGCSFKVTKDRNKNDWLVLTIPSGRKVFYFSPRMGKGDYGQEIKYDGVDAVSKKWTVLNYYRNKIIENIVQATARDILMEGRRRLINAGYKVIASVHDENIIELRYGNHESEWAKIKSIMETSPSWFNKMPLGVTGYCSRRYKKD